MSFATYSFQELGYVGHTTVTAWTVFHYSAVCFFTSALQITVHDSKKKKKTQTYAYHIHFKLMLFPSFLTQKKKKKSLAYSSQQVFQIDSQLTANSPIPRGANFLHLQK